MKSKIIVIISILLVAVFFTPFNKISYIKNLKGEVKLSRIDRSSLLFSWGTFFTPGHYYDHFLKPTTYVSPFYTKGGPFDNGCFSLFAEYDMDVIYIYAGSACETRNLNDKFQFIELPNAFGEKNWVMLSEDRTGKYHALDCNTEKKSE